MYLHVIKNATFSLRELYRSCIQHDTCVVPGLRTGAGVMQDRWRRWCHRLAGEESRVRQMIVQMFGQVRGPGRLLP